MQERLIEAYLRRKVELAGGIAVKQDWVGIRGAPDRLIMLPGRLFFIELKRKGVKPEPHQVRLHNRMRELGVEVHVVDDVDQVDELVK